MLVENNRSTKPDKNQKIGKNGVVWILSMKLLLPMLEYFEDGMDLVMKDKDEFCFENVFNGLMYPIAVWSQINGLCT